MLAFVSCDANGQRSFMGDIGYSVRKGYSALRGVRVNVPWAKMGVLRVVKLSLPRSSWIQWMVRVTKGRSPLARLRRRCLVAVVYFLWTERNCRVFHVKVVASIEVTSKLLSFLNLCNGI
ncbi:hypothetical protein Dimus_000351 [Dionaea muscipula]